MIFCSFAYAKSRIFYVAIDNSDKYTALSFLPSLKIVKVLEYRKKELSNLSHYLKLKLQA